MLSGRRFRFPVLLLVALLFSTDAPAQSKNDVVARVNGTPITVERFNASYVGHLIRTGQNDTPERRYAHLNDLIDAYLLGDEARRRGMEDVEYQEYLDREIKKAVGGRFFEIAFADSFPDPPDADVREAFRRSKEKVTVRHLFFNNPAEADTAFARLEAGKDFIVLANEVFGTASFDSSAGNLGVAGYWELDDAFAEAAFALPVGKYSRPVKSRYGWHIIRVDDRLYNPLLTELEYERRRDDTRHQLRARRFRLEGTRFVQSFMDSLDVRVNAEAMHFLREVIAETLREPHSSMPKQVLERQEVSAIETSFSPETVLATYELEGERLEFTAMEYFEWLADLPYEEVRQRTAASVGRALRNQALAERGLSLGLHADETVVSEVGHRADLFLAERLRTHLRTESKLELTEDELRSAFDHMGFRRLKHALGDFWQIRFETPAEAEAARHAILAGDAAPESYESYASFAGHDLRPLGELGTYVRKAPLQSPVVIGTGDGGWHVVRVDDRDVVYTSFEELRGEIADRVGPYVPEFRLIRDLRREAEMEIDTALFEEMMRW